MASLDIKNLFHDKRQVGRTVKASKVYYVWEFVLEGILNKIEFFHSIVSGKKSLVINGTVVSEEESYAADFAYSCSIKKHKMNIDQLSQDKLILKIDNYDFKTLMDDESQGTYKFIKKEKNKVEDLLSGHSNNKKQSNQNINVFTDNNFDFGFDENIKKKTSIIKGSSNSIYQNNQQNTQTNKQTNFDDIFNTGNNGQKSNKSNTNTFDDIFS
jgi:hypothetical protein